ncbi:BlaI/MecI/CopY family transcriptional regulator [Candidatus Latescibacterota bacterium]
MAGRKSRTFTEVELELMQLIWEFDELTTIQIQDILKGRGRYLADGSIRKMLSILMTKGHVKRRKVGRGHIYSAIVQKEKANSSIIHDIIDRVFSGSVPGMVASLLKTQDVSKEDIKEIKKLIAKSEKQGKK